MKDPDDAKFVQSAVDAGADFLVAGNSKHFPVKKFQRTSVVTPREFMEHIVKFVLTSEPSIRCLSPFFSDVVHVFRVIKLCIKQTEKD